MIIISFVLINMLLQILAMNVCKAVDFGEGDDVDVAIVRRASFLSHPWDRPQFLPFVMPPTLYPTLGDRPPLFSLP